MVIKRKIVFLCLAVILVLTGCNGGNTPEEEKRIMTYQSVYADGVALEGSLWQTPESYMDSERDKTAEKIQALYLRTKYKDEETYAFCYLGIPEGVSETNKAPAVLLLHGGAGTAYWEWVKMWRDRGYVALAVDLEGHIPSADGGMNLSPDMLYTKSQYNAPTNQNYNDASVNPIEETWMYYAVQTAILANSYLHSLAYVDNYKIGVCGVSWGGIITSIITGYDDRFAFSIPIYCTLNSENSSSTMTNYLSRNPNALVWDDPNGLYAVKTPVCFIASNIDAHGKLDSITKTYEGCQNATLVILKDMLHSQAIAVNVAESYNYADSIVKGATKLITVSTQPDRQQTNVIVSVPKGVSVMDAYLIYTQDPLSEASWSKRRVNVNAAVIDYTVPEDTLAFYIAVEDSRGNTICTKVVF